MYSSRTFAHNVPQFIYSLANFDGFHYLTIVHKGYLTTDLIQAFFPIYPLIIRLFNLIIGNLILSGLLTSLLFTYLSIYRLIQISSFILKNNERVKLLSLFLFFPTAYYFATIYNESLFIFLVLSSFLYAFNKKWFLAIFFAAIASATRIVGICLLPALLFEFYEQKGLFITKNFKQNIQSIFNITKKNYFNIFLLFCSGLGLVIYMVFLWINFDDPLYFFHVQSEFNAGRQEQLIIYPQVVIRYIKMLLTVRPINWFYYTVVLEFISGLLGLLLILLSFKLPKKSIAVFSLLAFIIPTFTGTFSSMPRYILVCLSIYFYLAKKLRGKYFYLYLVFSVTFFIINTILFISGHWIA